MEEAILYLFVGGVLVLLVQNLWRDLTPDKIPPETPPFKKTTPGPGSVLESTPEIPSRIPPDRYGTDTGEQITPNSTAQKGQRVTEAAGLHEYQKTDVGQDDISRPQDQTNSTSSSSSQLFSHLKFPQIQSKSDQSLTPPLSPGFSPRVKSHDARLNLPDEAPKQEGAPRNHPPRHEKKKVTDWGRSPAVDRMKDNLAYTPRETSYDDETLKSNYTFEDLIKSMMPRPHITDEGSKFSDFAAHDSNTPPPAAGQYKIPSGWPPEEETEETTRQEALESKTPQHESILPEETPGQTALEPDHPPTTPSSPQEDFGPQDIPFGWPPPEWELSSVTSSSPNQSTENLPLEPPLTDEQESVASNDVVEASEEDAESVEEIKKFFLEYSAESQNLAEADTNIPLGQEFSAPQTQKTVYQEDSQQPQSSSEAHVQHSDEVERQVATFPDGGAGDNGASLLGSSTTTNTREEYQQRLRHSLKQLSELCSKIDGQIPTPQSFTPDSGAPPVEATEDPQNKILDSLAKLKSVLSGNNPSSPLGHNSSVAQSQSAQASLEGLFNLDHVSSSESSVKPVANSLPGQKASPGAEEWRDSISDLMEKLKASRSSQQTMPQPSKLSNNGVLDQKPLPDSGATNHSILDLLDKLNACLASTQSQADSKTQQSQVDSNQPCSDRLSPELGVFKDLKLDLETLDRQITESYKKNGAATGPHANPASLLTNDQQALYHAACDYLEKLRHQSMYCIYRGVPVEITAKDPDNPLENIYLKIFSQESRQQEKLKTNFLWHLKKLYLR